MAPSGIEPATFRSVAQHLNPMCYRGPRLKTVVYKYLKFMEGSRGTVLGMSTFTCEGVVSVAIYMCQLPAL